ncbi:MAG TPA: CocE/NonD family hydrolase, partial [Ilumatobacteraceae bacterium]|nr:CocE/NonD family hydrolase [Ilumatobacteraceae bacterium]
MADGAVLVSDAWYPAAGGPWPVLLQRLPYGRSVASTPVLPHPAWFARRGYAVVVQDCRGRGVSAGTFAPFIHEASDGAESIEWAARLPFCDGRVGTYGFSYQGLAQLYAAARHPPSLHAIAPMMCCPDPYEGWTYEGGMLRWPFVCFWAAQLAGQDLGTGPIPFDTHALPIATALGDDPPSWFEEWLAHPRDDEYWAARRPDLDAIDVPAFTVMGWFDDFSSGTAAMIDRLGAEAWCGPWAHMPWGTRHGDAEFGSAASPAAVWDALVAFFDRTFERDDAPSPVGRVRYFVIGDDWRVSDS